MTLTEQLNEEITQLQEAGVSVKTVMEHLDRLKTDTNAIIGELPDTAFPGIYLPRASCANSRVGVREDGQLEHRVVVASQAPEEADFCRHVEQELEKRGWPNVTVVCEW